MPDKNKALKLIQHTQTPQMAGVDISSSLEDIASKLDSINKDTQKVELVVKPSDMMGALLNLIKGEKGEPGEGSQVEGPKGEKGDNGLQGPKGDSVQGPAGKDGAQGKIGPQGASITGPRGEDGKDGKDGSPDKPSDIKKKLESLKKDDRLDISAIKGTDGFKDHVVNHAVTESRRLYAGFSGVQAIKAGTNITVSKNARDEVTINSTGGGSGLTVGSTVITGGVNGNLLFDNNGVLGEQAAGTVSLTTTTKIWIDGNRVDAYTADGTISKPYKTISAFVSGFVVGSYQGVAIDIAPAAYTEASNVTFPNISTTIQANNATLTINGGAGSLTLPSSFDCYSLVLVGALLQTDVSTSTIHNFQDGAIIGNLTVSGFTTFSNSNASGGVITVNSGGILGTGSSASTSRVVNNGTFYWVSMKIVVNDNTNYAVDSSAAGSIILGAGNFLQNSGTGGGINCDNGATTTPNEFNAIDIVINSSTAAGKEFKTGTAVTTLNKYTITDTLGATKYATGVAQFGSTDSGLNNTGTYKDGAHSAGSNTNVLSSTGTATAWLAQSSLTAGHVTTNANLTGPITSSGNATAIASQTGTGTTFVVDTSPTLVTPTIGVATATSVNKMAITAPATSSTLAVADGKTLTASNTITLVGTDGVSINLSNAKKRMHGFTVDGGGSAISTGKVKGYFTCGFSGTITGWNIMADTGTVTVTTWKVATGTAVPTVANTISTAGVALSTGTAIHSSTVTDFTSTTVTANDIFAFNISAVSGVTQMSFELEITTT